MQEPVRIALVGLGDIAVRAHLPALLREPRAEVAALVDTDPSRIGPAAALAPGAQVVEDVEDVLTDPEIDAVVLATPPWATAGLARRAVEAGKYVLAEKPLAPTLAEQLELRTVPGAAERLQIGLTYRHHPAVERVHGLVRDEALGRPLYVQASLCDERSDRSGTPIITRAGCSGWSTGRPWCSTASIAATSSTSSSGRLRSACRAGR